MAFNGNEGEMIDPATAQKWIDNYQKGIDPKDTKWVFYGFRKLSELIGQENAIGIRMYFAKNDEEQDIVVLVATNAEGKNLAPIDGSSLEGLVLDKSTNCPPYCTVD